MDAAVIDLIKSIATDAIKIIGAGIVAAAGTYKATKVQFEMKLREATASHEFQARQLLFDYYKGRQERLSEEHVKVGESLGSALGTVSAAADDPEDVTGLVALAKQLVDVYSKLLPADMETTISDMEQNGMAATDDYRRLCSHFDSLRSLDEDRSVEALQGRITRILEAYGCLAQCNDRLLKRQMDAALGRYVAG